MAALSFLGLLHLFHRDQLPNRPLMAYAPHRAYTLSQIMEPPGDPSGKKFDPMAYTTLTVAWVITLAAMVVFVGLSLRMSANKRHFHQLMILVQATVLLGYSLTLGGFGLLPFEDRQHILVGRRDEFAIHYILPVVCLPLIIYLTNNMAGIFASEGWYIIGTLMMSTLYGLSALFLPRNWLGSFVVLLSAIFAVPYLIALCNTWPSSVKAAPKRVRRVLKMVCGLQLLSIAISLVTFDLAINQTISVNIEHLLLTISDLLFYTIVPGAILCSPSALKDVYSREEYIQQTRRAAVASLPTTASLTPPLSAASRALVADIRDS